MKNKTLEQQFEEIYNKALFERIYRESNDFKVNPVSRIYPTQKYPGQNKPDVNPKVTFTPEELEDMESIKENPQGKPFKDIFSDTLKKSQ